MKAPDTTEDFDLAPLGELFWQGRRKEAHGDVKRFVRWFEEQARQDPERMAHWVVRHEEELVGIIDLLVDHLADVEQMFGREWWDDEWTSACQTRSFFQWLEGMAPKDLQAVIDRDVDLEELDEMLRARGETEGGLTAEERPSGTPSTHWWWVAGRVVGS